MKILTLDSERKVLYISVAVNFFIGTVMGIILFYGQIRTDAGAFENGYIYDTAVTVTDFFRLSWINIIWIVSVFVSQGLIPVCVIHPVTAVKGCVCTFSTLYLLTLFGIKEATAAVLPQCFSALPLVLIFSAELALKRRRAVKNGNEIFSVKRRDAAAVLGLSMLAGTVEVLFFRLFCSYLF